MILQRIKINLLLAVVLPSVNVMLLQVWASSMRNLVDLLFILNDYFVYTWPFALILLLSQGLVTSQNPINSLLYLIGIFMSAIFVLLSIRIEFLSMIFLIVYIGAIAILFLFVIMLLNLKEGMPSNEPFLGQNTIWLGWLLVSVPNCLFFFEALSKLSHLKARTSSGTYNSGLFELNQINYFMRFGLSDASIFSELFYGTHGFIFLSTACLLAVSMIGAIVLALSTSETEN